MKGQGSTGPKRTAAQREEDLRLIGELYVQQYSYDEISAELTRRLNRPYRLSRTTIFKDVKKIEAEWKKERLIDYTAIKNRELDKLDALETQYWHGWRRSQIEQTTLEKRGKAGESGEEVRPTEIKKRTVTKVGDRSFLDGVLSVMARRHKLLGIDAPESFDVHNFNYTPSDLDEKEAQLFKEITGKWAGN